MNSLTSQSLSINQARQLALTAQGFASASVLRDRHAGKPGLARGLRQVMDRLQLLQLDSIPIIARTQYLPAFSRVGYYNPKLHDSLAYERDEWFEAWAHEASLLPVRHEPLLRWVKTRAQQGIVWRSLWRVATDEPAYVQSVLREVRDRGPLRAADLTDPRPNMNGSGWGRGSMGSLALDWLFRTGQLGVRRIGNFEKAFDLIERILPMQVLNQATPSEADAISQLLVLSAQAHGIGTANDLIDYFRLPVQNARPLIEPLVEDGRLEVCHVQGWSKPAYRVPGALRLRPVQARALISPFDPVVWYRDRAQRLFDFEYRLEIYTPEKKRRWGYYVLPFLLGDSMVARVDLKNDRAASVLRVLAAHLEPGHDAAHVATALAAELDLLARFVGAGRVVVGRRGNLSTALRHACRAHA